jgi:hypothetical protein
MNLLRIEYCYRIHVVSIISKFHFLFFLLVRVRVGLSRAPYREFLLFSVFIVRVHFFLSCRSGAQSVVWVTISPIFQPVGRRVWYFFLDFGDAVLVFIFNGVVSFVRRVLFLEIFLLDLHILCCPASDKMGCIFASLWLMDIDLYY